MHIRPIVRADLPDVAAIGVAAFSQDELVQNLLPGMSQYPKDYRDWALAKQRSRFLEPSMWGAVCVRDADEGLESSGVDSDGIKSHRKEEVLGYAWWKREAPASGSTLSSGGVYAGRNRTMLGSLERALEAAQAHYSRLIGRTHGWPLPISGIFGRGQMSDDPFVAVEEFWYLASLAVSPQHQRKNIGGRLVDWGLQFAREEGIPAAVTASPAGLGLYQKKGFRIINALALPEEEEGHPALLLDWTGEWIKSISEADGEVKNHGVKMEVVWTEKAKEGLTKKQLAKLPQKI